MNSVLTQLLIDVTRGHRKDAFAADPEAVLSGSALDPPTCAAVLSRDIGTLWLSDAHPMALMYFARASGWANERYYRCIADAEIKRAGPATTDLRAEPEPLQTRQSNDRHDP